METGFLLVNKPEDWTSHDVIGYLRKVTRIKRIGHAGTLDPFATGLLIVGIGRECTKRLDEFKDMRKTYVATLHLGAVSDTYDKTGVITENTQPTESIEPEKIEEEIKKFIGEQDQVAPMYSAKKVEGKPLYKLARQGIEVERKPHHITIFDIQILDSTFPLVKIQVQCSPGTYIRTLVHDIGQKLGVGAYCEALERSRIGDYTVEKAVFVKDLSKESWQEHLF